MTANAADASSAWENPLIPNARLRQIYVAMMQAQAVAKAAGRKATTTRLEACLVSPAIDLRPGDLISDALTGSAIDFLRGPVLSQRTTGHKKRRTRLQADCGAARPLICPGGPERIWTALGAAAAIKSVPAESAIGTAPETSVAIVYLRAEDWKPALHREALTFAAQKKLPAIFVVLPPANPRTPSTWCSLALRCGLPGIPTDADDAVAIYRVAQESIGHARIGGGPALIECVPFRIEGQRRSQPSNPVALLERHLTTRRIANAAWISRQQKAFAHRLARTSTIS